MTRSQTWGGRCRIGACTHQLIGWIWLGEGAAGKHQLRPQQALLFGRASHFSYCQRRCIN